MPADWERASLQPAGQASAAFKQSPQNGNVFHPSGGFSTGSLVADEESQEFDDLIFALKTGEWLFALLLKGYVAVRPNDVTIPWDPINEICSYNLIDSENPK